MVVTMLAITLVFAIIGNAVITFQYIMQWNRRLDEIEKQSKAEIQALKNTLDWYHSYIEGSKNDKIEF